MISTLRKLYRKHIHSPWLDRQIYRVLDLCTNFYAWACGYYFPKNFIRRWKLDIINSEYEKETVAVFKKIIKPGMTVLDIGGHIGFFTRLFSKMTGKNGKVIAIEADPENFSFLQKNTRKLKNVKNFFIAASDKVGTIDFFHCPEKSGCHSTLENIPLNFKTEKISVTATDLDSLLAKQGITKIDVIKMDIEGGEVAALVGMKKLIANSPNLKMITEFAPDWIIAAGKTPLEFLKNLTNLGFKISAIVGDTLVPISSNSEESYKKILPKPNANDSYNSFLNLYCTK